MKKISSFLLLLFLLAIVPAVVMLEVLFHDGLPEAQGQQAASQLEQSIRDHLPFQQQLRQMVTEVRYRLGMREQSSVFISENSLVENVSGPYGDFVRQNTQAILDFTERYGVSTYVALIPNSCVIRQDEIPPLATVYNQKSLFDYVYDRLAGSAICIDTYTSLYANNDKYLYYRTKELPTSLGGFYIYTAVGGKLGVAPREIDTDACAVESEALFLSDDLEYGAPIPCDSDLADRLIEAEEEGNAALVELSQPGDIDNLLDYGGMSRLPILLHADEALLLDEALRRFPGRLLVDSLCEIERPLLEDIAARYGALVF